MTTVQVSDDGGSTWRDIAHQQFQIDLGLRNAPTASVDTTANEDVSANQPLRIQISGTTRFRGVTRSPGSIDTTGSMNVEAWHEVVALFDERVTFSLSSPTDEDVWNEALTQANRGGDFTLNHDPTAVTLDEYEADNRSVRSIAEDLADRTGYTYWIDPVSNDINVQTEGARGTWETLEAGADAAEIRTFDTGDVSTVRNDVTVTATRGTGVSATATDSTSISEYGRRSADYNIAYAATQSEAQAIADSLLEPDPVGKGDIVVQAQTGTIEKPLVNYVVDYDDATKGISEDDLLVTKQTIRERRAILKVGGGQTVLLNNSNRRTRSDDDKTDSGFVMPNDRIGDDAVDTPQLVDTAVINDKLADAAVATAKLQNNAVINGKLDDLSVSETKIQDDSIATPKLQASAVTANEIAADTITASEIAAGTITATEITADTITASEITAGTITATEIAAGTLTANEVDTLDLDTNQLTIGNETTDQIVFDTDSGFARAKPSTAGEGAIGTQTTKFGAFWGDFGEFDLLRGDELRMAGGTTVARFEPGSATGAIEITDDDGVTSASDASIRPDADDDGMLGAGDGTNSDRAWQEIHTTNLYQYSPQALDPAPDGVSETDLSPRRNAEGAGNVDLSALTDHCWDDPPEYVSQGERPDGSYAVDDGAVEHGHLLNYLWETCKAQQEKIDNLEERLSRLESQI